MSQPSKQDQAIFIQVLAQVAAGTLQRLHQEGKGDCIKTVVGNAMYGVKLHEKGGIQIFRESAFLIQEDGKKEQPVIIQIEEAASVRGKRDGSGPYKGSARKAAGMKGRRKAAGASCPNTKPEEAVNKLDTAIDTLIS